MVAITKTQFRVSSAKQFVASINNSVGDTYYLAIGRPIDWNNVNDIPELPIDNDYNDLRIYDQLMAAKKIQASNAAICVPRSNWVFGIIYDPYDDNYSSANKAPSGASDLYMSNFYVVTDEFNVYKCIDNNNNSPSSIKPTGTASSMIYTSDGYIWKYLYSISAAEALKFFTPTFMIAKNADNAPTNSNEYIIRQTAVAGAIHRIRVVNAGIDYTTATVTITGNGVGATASAVIVDGSISKILITSHGSGYTKAVITITGDGTGAEASAVLPPPNGHGYDPILELGGLFSMINVRLEFNDGGVFPVNQDFRQLVVITNPYNKLNVAATEVYLNCMKSLAVTIDPNKIPQPDDIITGYDSEASAIVVTYDENENVLYYVQTESTGYLDFIITEQFVIERTNDVGTIDAYIEPDLKHYSGSIAYVENRGAITRDTSQIENIKLILEH